MTGMDLNLARMPAAADAAGVQSVGARGDDAGAAHAGDGFHNALKSVANDKHGKDQTSDGRAAQKAGSGKTRDAMLERLRQLEATAGTLGSEDALQPHGAARPAKDVAEGELGEEADAQDASEEPSTGAEAATGSAEKALALILGHATSHGNQGQKDAKTGNDKAGATVPAEALDATASTDQPLRNVKIVSVKVETHFAPLGTPAIAASLAQKIANAGAAGAAGGAGKAQDGKAGEATAKSGTDHLASLKDLDFAQASADGRGKLVAGAERRGADGSGSGKGSNADAKPTAEIGEPKAAAALADGLAAAPGQGGSPVEQLGHRVVAVAQELRSEAAGHVAATGTDTGAAAAPVRVLSINLHPEELGSVTVRMSLVRDALEVQIEAEHPSTARMLHSDSSALSDMLRSAGVQVDGITVRAAAPDTVSANTGSTQSMLDQQSQGGGTDARASGGRQNGQQDFGERTSGRKSYEDDTSQRNAAGGIYV